MVHRRALTAFYDPALAVPPGRWLYIYKCNLAGSRGRLGFEGPLRARTEQAPVDCLLLRLVCALRPRARGNGHTDGAGRPVPRPGRAGIHGGAAKRIGAPRVAAFTRDVRRSSPGAPPPGALVDHNTPPCLPCT